MSKRPPGKRSRNDTSNDSQHNARSDVPQLDDLFNNFRRPDHAREFKTEPMDDDTWQDIQEKEAAAAEAQKKKQKNSDPPRTRSRTNTARQQNESSKKAPVSDALVDLTEDTDDETRKSPVNQNDQTRKQVSTANRQRIKPLNVVQVQYMDSMQIPNEILDQAKAIYSNENIPFPPTLRLWAHLKHFVTNQPSAVLNLQLVLMMQAHVFYSSSQSSLAKQQPRHLSSAAQPPDLDTFDSMRRIKVENEVAEREQQSRLRTTPSAVPVSPVPHVTAEQHPIPAPQARNHQNQIHHTQPEPNLANERRIDSTIQALVKPIDLMPDILPIEAPQDHPHLVNAWDEKLLALPTNVHQHMDLMDTVVSIIARYDLQARAAIEGFLDFAQVHHFFFVFKARDKHMHSWSIEREGDTVTIGIERKSRAIRKLNEAEIEACSSGRIDLSIQFEITHPPEPPTSETDSPPMSTPPKSFPKYTLTASTLLPSTPNLATFLYETPPTRGADEHAHISHPLQTALLDPANQNSEYRHALSILARYMQHTIFTARAIDAEIQTVWGRKLRFDPVLGRVRPVWDYALKGAKTQRLKRERGEYNRPTNTTKKSKKRSDGEKTRVGDDEGKKERSEKGAHPGKGSSKEFLKNGGLNRSKQTSLQQVSVDNAVDEDDGMFVPEDTMEVQRAAELNEAVTVEPPRKRVKREGQVSGSEWSESETYSD